MFREPSFVAFVVGFADVKSKPMSSLKGTCLWLMFEHKHEWEIFRAKILGPTPHHNFQTIIDNASVHSFSVFLNHNLRSCVI